MQFNELVVSQTETCNTSPLQYEGMLADGRHFYFRYRWGYASLGIGHSNQAAILDTGVSYEANTELDGWMSRTDYEKTFVWLYLLHPAGNVLQSSTED